MLASILILFGRRRGQLYLQNTLTTGLILNQEYFHGQFMSIVIGEV